MEKSSVAVQEVQIPIEEIEQLYTLKNKEEIIVFLEKYPFLVPLVLEAPTKIKKYFPNSPLFLEVNVDAEISTWVTLVIAIDPEYSPKKTFKKYKEFRDGWWREVFSQGQNKLHIMPEYQ